MIHYIRKRLLTAVPVFFGITLLVFFCLELVPANITDLGGEEGGTAGNQAVMEERLGLDRPVVERYLS